MEEEIYTDDEKELFELLKWTIEVSTNFPQLSENDKKAAEANVEEYEGIKEGLISLAISRNKFYKETEANKLRHLLEYKDVTCTQCKFFTALKPVGEKVGDEGFSYAVYECPKCGTKFSENLPIHSEDRIKAGEILIKKMRKKKVAKDDIENLEKAIEKMRETNKDVEVKTADLLKLYDDHAKDVSDLIVKFMVHKQNVSTGSKDTNIN